MIVWMMMACGAVACPEGEVRNDGECTPYEAGEPVDAGEAWQPAPGTTWQWQLTGTIDTSLSVEMFDVDLFNVSDADVAALSDRTLICYFSAGSIEDWRSDAADFPDEAVGNKLDGWDGENWIDVMNMDVRDIMKERMELAADRGCDGVEPDNVDAYANSNGLGINATEQLDYNRFLADTAHGLGLSVGLKNDLDQLDDLEPWFDWGLNEECAAYDECGRLSVFTELEKAVFHVEYVDDWADAPELSDEVCGVGPDLDTLIKTWDLGSEYLACG